jgi:tetratricopeptide (TPR) repeat protein
MKAVVLFVSLSLAASPPAHAGKQSTSVDPSYFQESYDQEAMGHNQEALAALDKLSPEKNGSYVALLRRGWLHYRLGKNGPAVEAYTKAIAMAPKAVEPRLGILLPLMADKQWAPVEKQAREVLKLDPESYLGTLRLAFALYSQNKLAEALSLYQKLVDGYPSDTEARSGLGWTLFKLHKTKEATAVFRALLDFSPKNVLAQQGLAATGSKP